MGTASMLVSKFGCSLNLAALDEERVSAALNGGEFNVAWICKRGFVDPSQRSGDIASRAIWSSAGFTKYLKRAGTGRLWGTRKLCSGHSARTPLSARGAPSSTRQAARCPSNWRSSAATLSTWRPCASPPPSGRGRASKKQKNFQKKIADVTEPGADEVQSLAADLVKAAQETQAAQEAAAAALRLAEAELRAAEA